MTDPARRSSATPPTDGESVDRGDRFTPRRARRLFDLRYLIGGVLALYGVVGLLDGAAARRRADGIRINLWTGIVLIVVAVLFLLWGRFGSEASRPGAAQAEERGPEEHR